MSLLKGKPNRTKQFKKLSENKSEKEKRELEFQLLKPEPIPQYTGKLPENFGINALTVSIVFPNKQVKTLAEKFLKISFSKVRKQQYITDISMIINLLKQLDNGSLVYKDHKFNVKKRKKSCPQKRKL